MKNRIMKAIKRYQFIKKRNNAYYQLKEQIRIVKNAPFLTKEQAYDMTRQMISESQQSNHVIYTTEQIKNIIKEVKK